LIFEALPNSERGKLEASGRCGEQDRLNADADGHYCEVVLRPMVRNGRSTPYGSQLCIVLQIGVSPVLATFFRCLFGILSSHVTCRNERQIRHCKIFKRARPERYGVCTRDLAPICGTARVARAFPSISHIGKRDFPRTLTPAVLMDCPSIGRYRAVQAVAALWKLKGSRSVISASPAR
jgi:hypothetical protein